MTQKGTLSEPVGSVAEVARAAFTPGFFSGEALREEHRVETGLRLAYALRAAQVEPGRLHALALAVRDVGDAEPLEGKEKERLTDKQQRMLQGLIAEKGLPAPFRELLEAALPRLSQRRDLAALYGVLSGAYERMGRIEAVRGLPTDVPTPEN